MFEVDCDHRHSAQEKVNLLISRRNITRGGIVKVSGMVVDVIFRQDEFKVTLDNGLDFYLPNAPSVGEKIALNIPTTGIKCLG